MGKKIFLIIGVFLLVFMQVLVFMNMTKYALVLLFTGLVAALIYYIINYRISGIKIKLPQVAAIISLIIGAIATIIVKSMPLVALGLYVAAAVCLFFAKPKEEGFWQIGDIRKNYTKPDRWELWLVLIFFLITILIRFVALNDAPAGVFGHEVTQRGETYKLGGRYIWHGGASCEWPTMTLYQAKMFAGIFGDTIGSYRLSGAFWGAAIILIFYFLARTLFSPSAAFFASVLFSFSAGQLMISRNFAPNSIMYASVLLATWLFIAAIRNKKWIFFALSGLMLGFTLHGYMAGRVLPGVLGLWAIYLWIFKKSAELKIRHMLFMLGGFLISAGPIFYWAAIDPANYWAYFNSVNPNAHKGFKGYVDTIMGSIRYYAAAFHIKGDTNPSMQVPCKNMLEPIAATLFPIGLFLSILMIFTPVGSYVLLFFVLCLLPALLGSGSSGHPTLARMFGVFSPIYLMIAFVFERVKNSFDGFDSKVKKYLFIVVSVIVVSVGAYNGLHEYFVELLKNKQFRIQMVHGNYLTGQEIKKSGNSRVVISPRFREGILLPSNKVNEIALWPEDFLILDPSVNQLIAMEPYLQGTTMFFKENFPNSDIKIYSEPEDANNNYCVSYNTDNYYGDTYLSRVKISKDDIQNFQSLVDVKTGERVDINNPDFGSKYAGKHMKMKAALILKEAEKNGEIRISLPGWKMRKGNNETSGRIAFNNPGIHYFVIEGDVPRDFTGPLPLQLLIDGNLSTAFGRIIGLKDSNGLKMQLYQETKPPYGEVRFTKNILLPSYRISDGLSAPINSPFTAVFTGFIRARETGSYKIELMEPIYAKVLVGGKIVKNTMQGDKQVAAQEIQLKANELIDFKAYFFAFGGSVQRTFILKNTDKDGKILFDVLLEK